MKKEHQLDITKRKHQYESKSEHYFKFFQLLDQFTQETNSKMQENLIPIIEEFNRNYLNASSQKNKKGETNAITAMTVKMQKIAFDASQDLIKIKQETNTIRLIASDEVIENLDLLTSAHEYITDISNQMMRLLPALILKNDQVGMASYQSKIEEGTIIIKKIKDNIISLMRNELNEI